MSGIATRWVGGPCYAAQNIGSLAGQKAAIHAARQAATLSLVLTALVVGVVFFVSGHDLFVSRAVAYTQTADEMQSAAVGGNLVRRLAFFALAGWGTVLVVSGRQRLAIHWPLAGSLFLLGTLAAASVLWTEETGMCLRRLLVLACCIVAALGIARALSLRELAWLIVLAAGPLVMVGLAAELALGTFRPWASDYRFAGTLHPNTQGPTLAAICMAVLALVKDGGRYRPLLWSIFAAAAVLLLLTKSRTTAAALIMAIGAMQVVRIPLRTQGLIAVVSCWLMAAGLFAVCASGVDSMKEFREVLLLGRSDEAESLSGRAFIWPEVIAYARERFWLGYGYEAFWTPARIEVISENLGWALREAHNGYLEFWLWLGMIGLALLLVTAASAIAAAFRGYCATLDATYTVPLGLTAFGLLDSFSESGFVVVSLVPFLFGCLLVRLGLFGSQHKRGSGAGSVVPLSPNS